MRFSLCFDWQQLKVSNALVCFPAYPNRKGHKKMPGYICWHVQHGCLLLLQIRVQQVDVHVAKRSLCQEPWILSLKPSDCLWRSDEKPREDDDNDDDNEGRQRRTTTKDDNGGGGSCVAFELPEQTSQNRFAGSRAKIKKQTQILASFEATPVQNCEGTGMRKPKKPLNSSIWLQWSSNLLSLLCVIPTGCLAILNSVFRMAAAENVSECSIEVCQGVL